MKRWRCRNFVVGLFVKKREFHHFTVMVGVSRFSRVRVSVSISFSDGAGRTNVPISPL